jgi:hypothetical protein
MDKLITERDEEAIDADLKAMVEAAQRAEARNSKPAVSPLHEVGACLHALPPACLGAACTGPVRAAAPAPLASSDLNSRLA